MWEKLNTQWYDAKCQLHGELLLIMNYLLNKKIEE
jgi:hypothetical protein